MNVLTKEETELRIDELRRKIKEGAVFIHPTDTIYGIGCDATNDEAVSKIRELKKRKDTPFSVIAPDKEWILSHCKLNDNHKHKLEEIPGPVTLIMKLKNTNNLSEHTNPGLETLGVRIPDHWFSQVVQKIGIPIVTTSANIMGEDFMTELDNLNPHIKTKMDFIIYEGEKVGRPSKIIDLTKDEVHEHER